MEDLENIMSLSPVIPVIVIDRLTDAVPLARALVEGGLTVLEVTLRTPQGLQAIADISAALPEAVVGAGTVLSKQDVIDAQSAGARFLVSPGCTPQLLRSCQERDIALLPGVNTPSEAMALLESGQQHLKFFPAEAAGGIAMLKAMYGPLPQLRFCPTGGVSTANAGGYLALPNVLCVGGTWMLDKATIAKGDWTEIRRLAGEAAALSSPSI